MSACNCPHGMVSGGSVSGIRMPPMRARLSTTKNCPVHDTCQGYTAAHRATRPEWSNPYCPIHKTANCPERRTGFGLETDLLLGDTGERTT